MTTTQIAVRLPDPVLAAVDEYVAILASRMPGVKYSRSDVFRSLLIRALAEEGVAIPELAPEG